MLSPQGIGEQVGIPCPGWLPETLCHLVKPAIHAGFFEYRSPSANAGADCHQFASPIYR
jgi:hypothetical protein